MCPKAVKEKLWRHLLQGWNHSGETPHSQVNTPKSPIMGKYLPTAGAATGNWPQLSKPPMQFVSCLSVQLELARGSDIIRMHPPAPIKPGGRENATKQKQGGGCVWSHLYGGTQDGVPKRGLPHNKAVLSSAPGLGRTLRDGLQHHTWDT